MPEAHVRHEGHSHAHGPGCGHKAVKHDGHVDYLHNGHLHNVHGDSVHEHTIEVSPANPNRCTPKHQCSDHQGGHVHGPNCGHEAVPHGDHVDYLVGDHLHHPHEGHCDDHGKLRLT